MTNAEPKIWNRAYWIKHKDAVFHAALFAGVVEVVKHPPLWKAGMSVLGNTTIVEVPVWASFLLVFFLTQWAIVAYQARRNKTKDDEQGRAVTVPKGWRRAAMALTVLLVIGVIGATTDDVPTEPTPEYESHSATNDCTDAVDVDQRTVVQVAASNMLDDVASNPVAGSVTARDPTASDSGRKTIRKTPETAGKTLPDQWEELNDQLTVWLERKPNPQQQ